MSFGKQGPRQRNEGRGGEKGEKGKKASIGQSWSSKFLQVTTDKYQLSLK